MEVKTLDHSTFEEIVECFLKSFQNYFVPMPAEPEYFRARWKSSKVKFDHSYGMYEGGILIGFILHGIDTRGGERLAYNAGTGVLPEFRGKRIVKRIYEKALPMLKSQGITRSILEVITQNEYAIRAYEKVGFEIRRTLHCFKGEIKVEDCKKVELQRLVYQHVSWQKIPNMEKYSWDYQRESLEHSECSYFLVGAKEKPVAYFARNATGDGVAQMESLDGSPESWKMLFCALKSMGPTMKIINVDHQLSEKINWLKKNGLDNFLDQYEMDLVL